MITKNELAELMDEFLQEKGLWNLFVEFAEEKGYSEDELEKASDSER